MASRSDGSAAAPPVGTVPDPQARPFVTTATIMMAPLLSVSPIFLLGGLSILVREDLGFGEATLGLLTGVFFAASAFTTVPGGRLADRIGAGPSLRVGMVCTGVSLLAIAVGARSSLGLAFWLIISGASNGLVHPASNLGLVRGVSVRRQGLAFGAKQAAIPLATLVAGLAVPAVGLTVGWRWAFGIAALACLPLMLTIVRVIPVEPRSGASLGRRKRSPALTPTLFASAEPPRVPLMKGRRLVLVAFAGAFAGAAASSLAMFFVGSAVESGIDLATAGLLLSFGSVLSILARLLAGWYSDRASVDPLTIVLLQLIAGALGFVFLRGSADRLGLFILATMIAFFAGWGWAGLLQFAVVRRNPDAPATATAMTQTGVYVGNVIGPIGFGVIASELGYTIAWRSAASALAVSATLLWMVRRRVPPSSVEPSSVALTLGTDRSRPGFREFLDSGAIPGVHDVRARPHPPGTAD